MHDALRALVAHFCEKGQFARSWKAQGRGIVGYVGEAVPRALIESFGFLPYRVFGDPSIDQEILDRALYPLFSKAQSGRGFLEAGRPRSILARILSGDCGFLDHFVVPHGRKEETLLLTHLRNAKAADPQLPVPDLLLLDRAVTPSYSASLYDRQSVARFASRLAEWAGRPFSHEALNAAIAAHNERCELIDGLLALRKAARLPGGVALQILGAASLLPAADCNKLLRVLLAETSKSAPRKGPRLLLGGSAIDHSALYETIESIGATIVGEIHGPAASDLHIPLGGSTDPLAAVAESFHQAPRTFAYPLRLLSEKVEQAAQASRPDAAIIITYRGDDLARFDAPELVSALDRVGIPVLHLADQPYEAENADAIKSEVARFLTGKTGSTLQGGS